MPGMMSKIFDTDNGEDHDSSQTTTVEGDGETGVEASPEVTIAMSGSHENADGSTSEWSHETSAGAQVDLDVAAATATSLTDSGSDQVG